MPGRQPIGIKHEYIKPNPEQICNRWSCRWNPSHGVCPDGNEIVIITSIIFCARQDKTPANICNCTGYYFSQYKKDRPSCYHVELLREQVLKIHARELAKYEANVASAQDQYTKACNGTLKIPRKKYQETKLECEKVLIAAIADAKNYLLSYPYLMDNWESAQDFPYITKHTELMRREHGKK